MKGNTRRSKPPQQVEDPDLEKKRKNRLRNLKRKEIKELTIAERLTLSALERFINVPFKDSHGEFTVKMHMPLRDEYDEIVRLEGELKSKDAERMEKASASLFKAFASLCVDNSLNYEFWESGAYDPMDMLQLMAAVTSEMAEKVQEAQSFRKE